MKYRVEKNKRGYLPLVVSILLLAAGAAALEILYLPTKYIPLRLVSAICAYLALVNTVLFIVGISVFEKEKKRDKPAAQDREKERSAGGGGRFAALVGGTVGLLGRAGRAVLTYISRARLIIAAAALIIVSAGCQLYFFLMLRRLTSLTELNFILPVVLLFFFIVYIAAEKWLKHTEEGDTRVLALLRNLRGALAISRFAMLLTIVSAVLKILNIYDAQKWLSWALAALWIYASVFVTLSLLVLFIKKEVLTSPKINVPLPFAGGGDRDLGVLSYLEENTGITMRSLFSLRMARAILPYTLLVAVLLFWFSTGIMQIESHQEGAVYRLGRLEEKTLDPGLHITLPWPLDKTEVYNTSSLSKMTIGYRSATDTDNTWTGNHGNNEYKLLLGGGDELVSINLRLEYRISDLGSYLTGSAAPERLLEALAYEIVTDRTTNTDLEELLSADRSKFAEDIRADIEKRLELNPIGLSVVSVVLESIHPPVEVAAIYQRIISAEIESEKYILDAEAKAAVALWGATAKYDTALSAANAEYYTKTATAKADVAHFMASVGADREASDSYRYYKYLKAIGGAYQGSRLVIVGEGIDSSNIYFGAMMLE